MNIKIKEIKDKMEWNRFLNNVEQKTFLHSWQWGEFQKKMEFRIWNLGVYDKDNLIGVALVLKIVAKRGVFLFIPHGPIILTNNEQREINEIYKKIIEYLKELANKENCSFIRISPILEDNENNRELFKKLCFKLAPAHMHAERTWIIDINKDENDILSCMRKTTRNLIRQSLKNKELKLDISNNLDDFYDIYKETSKRQGFSGFTKKYLQKELDAFGENAKVFLIKNKDNILAGAIAVFFDYTAYYHHSASIHSKLPAAYLMNWEIIREARKKSCKFYNMWGVAEENDKKHPWFGLSLFKRGFGGKELNLMRAQDLPLKKVKYFINWIIETIRTKKRNY